MGGVAGGSDVGYVGGGEAVVAEAALDQRASSFGQPEVVGDMAHLDLGEGGGGLAHAGQAAL